MTGYLHRGGARLTAVVIRAPRRARVAIGCRGVCCPYRARRMRVGASRLLRLRSLERYLPAGSRIVLSITQPKRIGKRVTYRIRRGRPPLRWDGCLVPGQGRALRCY
jgi:hypothetical protein